jgi:D-alanine-D-alanine ligase
MVSPSRIAILRNEIASDASEDVLDIGRQAEWIACILAEKGYRAETIPFSLTSLDRLAAEQEDCPAVVFNLVDSAPGEESLSYLVPGILDHLGLPYTGCSLQALLATTDKVGAKRTMEANGIPTPRWTERPEDGSSHSPQGSRYLLKPRFQDASVGLDQDCLVDRVDADTWRRAEAKSGEVCFAEQYIDGREFGVCVYGSRTAPVIMPPFEWIFEGFGRQHLAPIITYDAKWTEHTFAYDHIQPKYRGDETDRPLLDRLVAIAGQCWDAFGLEGYARIDFRIDGEGNPWVLEVNGNPSFYPFYHLALEGGSSFEDLVEQIALLPYRYRSTQTNDSRSNPALS